MASFIHPVSWFAKPCGVAGLSANAPSSFQRFTLLEDLARAALRAATARPRRRLLTNGSIIIRRKAKCPYSSYSAINRLLDYARFKCPRHE